MQGKIAPLDELLDASATPAGKRQGLGVTSLLQLPIFLVVPAYLKAKIGVAEVAPVPIGLLLGQFDPITRAGVTPQASRTHPA